MNTRRPILSSALVPVTVMRDQDSVVGAELLAPKLVARHATFHELKQQHVFIPEHVRTELHTPQVLCVGLPFLVIELV